VRADEVFFGDGDRLSGKIVALTEGKLKFRSPVVGEVSIERSAIRRLASAEAIELHLADGTVIRDQLLPGEAGQLSTAGTGKVSAQTFALADLEQINPPPEEPVRWHPDLTLAAKFERGNTIKDEADLSLKARRESPENRVWFLGTYEGERNTDPSTHDSTTSDRRIEAELKYDQFLGERWYWFARTKGTRDGVLELDLLFLAGAGPGYRWFRSERTRFDTEFGPAWVSSNFEDSSKDDDSVALLGSWHFSHQLTDSMELFSDLDWLIIEWSDRHYVDSNFGLRSHLTSRLFVEAKIDWEYTTDAATGTERQDTDYLLGLGYRF
jgi:putative salt-induced outer membrane protein YdiY